MAYHHNLAARVRAYLSKRKEFQVEEKTMFGGLAFMINGKMCINVGDDQLMCRFDPNLTDELSARTGFLPMIMKGRQYKGYCYVDPIGYQRKEDFEFWINLCLDYNDKAKSSKKRNTKDKS
jgi:TfoX/Sxy family transcriptional regulator of competence genes